MNKDMYYSSTEKKKVEEKKWCWVNTVGQSLIEWGINLLNHFRQLFDSFLVAMFSLLFDHFLCCSGRIYHSPIDLCDSAESIYYFLLSTQSTGQCQWQLGPLIISLLLSNDKNHLTLAQGVESWINFLVCLSFACSRLVCAFDGMK